MTLSAKDKTDPIGDALHAITATPSNKKAPHVKKAEPVAEKAPAPAEVKRLQRKLNITRIQLAGYLHNTFDATVERGTVIDDLKDPSYWSNVAQQFKPLDHIKVTAEDGTWGAYLRIIACDRTWAKVHVESVHDYSEAYSTAPSADMSLFDIRWTTLGQYAIIRKDCLDGTPPLKENFQTQAEAYRWLAEYLRDLKK